MQKPERFRHHACCRSLKDLHHVAGQTGYLVCSLESPVHSRGIACCTACCNRCTLWKPYNMLASGFLGHLCSWGSQALLALAAAQYPQIFSGTRQCEKSDTSWNISICVAWLRFLQSEVAAEGAVALYCSSEKKQDDALVLATASKWL